MVQRHEGTEIPERVEFGTSEAKFPQKKYFQFLSDKIYYVYANEFKKMSSVRVKYCKLSCLFKKKIIS